MTNEVKLLTARDWIERAKETLDERTRDEDDTQLLDAYDDLCHALEAMDSTDERRHWMIEVQDSINEYRVVQPGYFDGTEAEAREYFRNNRPWNRYFGDERYQIVMRVNPIILQEPNA